MFNKEFYPTPRAVIVKMLAPFDDYKNTESYIADRHILEPSAGSGAFLDYLHDRGVRHGTVHAIEIEPELQSILRGKGHTVVHDDFLSFQPTMLYDLIIMNPPFSNADEHLLHAWDIMPEGDIACLLPSEMIRNPYTQRRELLADLIAQHGTVEHLGPVFAKSARPTDVEVALVRLKKVDSGKRFGVSRSAVGWAPAWRCAWH